MRKKLSRLSMVALVALGMSAAFMASPVATAAQQTPLTVVRQDSFAVGGTIQTEPGGFKPQKPLEPASQNYHGDPATGFYQVPVKAK